MKHIAHLKDKNSNLVCTGCGAEWDMREGLECPHKRGEQSNNNI